MLTASKQNKTQKQCSHFHSDYFFCKKVVEVLGVNLKKKKKEV